MVKKKEEPICPWENEKLKEQYELLLNAIAGFIAKLIVAKAIRSLVATPAQRRAVRLAGLNGHVKRVL